MRNGLWLLGILTLAAACNTMSDADRERVARVHEEQMAQWRREDAGFQTLARQVRFTSNPDVVKDCKFVSNVTGQISKGNFVVFSAVETASILARKLGADTLFSVQSGSHITGEAYLCAPPKP